MDAMVVPGSRRTEFWMSLRTTFWLTLGSIPFQIVLALLIAVCGITLTLIVLARERISELALYRALGARRRQIFRVFRKGRN